jgi:hypothetical protein
MPVVSLAYFDIWQEGYGGAVVWIYLAGTDTPADIYADEDLTVPLDQPQTLASQTVNGVPAGKWDQPIYVNDAVEVLINSIDRTGIIRPPVTELEGEDVSESLVTPEGGSVASELNDVLGRIIYAEDYGELGSSAATNTTTLAAAIGAAAGQGGGRVVSPAGTFPHNALNVPLSVIMKGQGRGVTVFECQVGAACWTMTGDRSGFEDCTLDGVNLVANSIGVFSTGKNEIYFSDVEVKNFDINVQAKGIARYNWHNLYIDNCGASGYGVHLRGDNNSGNGGPAHKNEWVGGLVTNCTGRGVFLEYEDELVKANAIRDVGFEDNTGIAVYLDGAKNTIFDGCWWEGNTVNLFATDGIENGGDADDHKTETILVADGFMEDGEVHFEGTCSDVIFQRMILDGELVFELDATLQFAITAMDCIEGPDVTITGVGTRFQRFQNNEDGETFGITTDATATKAWALHLEPGQVAIVTAWVVANQQNGVNSATYLVTRGFRRLGATLPYDTQTANFTVGDIITGQTSGASGRCIGDADGGATGTLTFRDIEGAFIDNEIITGSIGGSATVNGTLSVPTLNALAAIVTTYTFEDVAGWGVDIAANSPEVEVRVTGAASTTIEWSVRARAVIT